jgi:PAS domain S-box-containing protein
MIKAVIGVPLHKAGRFVAGMTVHQAQPRHWRADEVDLHRTVAARCWESIERTRIARDLRENEERLRMAQEAGGVGTFEYDIQRQISRGSEVFYRIFQAPPGATEYNAQDWARIIHPEDRDGVFSALQRAIESPQIIDTSDEYRLLLPDRTVRWVSYNGRVTRDVTGKALGIIGTVADVTAAG